MDELAKLKVAEDVLEDVLDILRDWDIEEYVNEFRGDDNLIRWHIIADAYLKTNNIVEAV